MCKKLCQFRAPNPTQPQPPQPTTISPSIQPHNAPQPTPNPNSLGVLPHIHPQDRRAVRHLGHALPHQRVVLVRRRHHLQRPLAVHAHPRKPGAKHAHGCVGHLCLQAVEASECALNGGGEGGGDGGVFGGVGAGGGEGAEVEGCWVGGVGGCVGVAGG